VIGETAGYAAAGNADARASAQMQAMTATAVREFERQHSKEVWSAVHEAWGDPDWRPPGGESNSDVCARATRFLDRLYTVQDHTPWSSSHLATQP
jgi:broad specificity phosphatase PhoE